VNYLFDTNHAIAYLNGDHRLTPYLRAAQRAGSLFSISTTVLGELYYGAYVSQRAADNLIKLATFASHLVVFPFDEAAAVEFGKICAEQRSKGKPIPTADAQIAAVARLHDLVVLTNDAPFYLIDTLKIENWLLSS
jgi:tRNA(fMet)-specific endonuclease VapC